MITIAVVTGARSDFGIWLPVLRAIREATDFRLRLLVCGMHLSHQFGHTIDNIRAEGFEPDSCIETLLGSDSPEAVAKSMGLAVLGFAQEFAAHRPDLLLLLGDRTEMFAAGCAALPFGFPIGHIHGGERSEGAIDEVLRHSLTKMAHLHFPSTDEHARRIIQLGEDPDQVFVCGAPALDHLRDFDFMDRAALERTFGLNLRQDPIIVTYHPVTTEADRTEEQITALLAALDGRARPILITYPNADTAGGVIIAAIERFAAGRSEVLACRNLGTRGFFSFLKIAAAMVGNSSSGLIEAPSFHLPVVNIGNRQKGRLRAANVIDCGYRTDEIGAAIERALSTDFKASLATLRNPYGDGQAATRIVNVIRSKLSKPMLLTKHFHDS